MSDQASLKDISAESNEEARELSEESKRTILGEIPEDWSSDIVENLFLLENGSARENRSSSRNTSETEGEIDVYGANGKIAEYDDSNLNKGLVIGRVGTVGSVYEIDRPTWVSDNAIKAKLDSDNNLKFLYYVMKRGRLDSLANQTAHPLLNQGIVGSVRLPLPEKDEQRRIASVLYNVYQAIQKTEEIIEQTQRVKKGLMQDLFTEGYFDHKEFGESRFAKFPAEWDSKQVRDLIDEGVIEKIMDGNHGERHPTSEDFIEEGIPFVTSDIVWNSHIDWEEAKRISEETYENLRKGFAQPGDVLLTHKGSVGRVGRVPEDKEKVMLSPQVTYYRINDKEILDPEYLRYFFRSSFCQKQMAGHSQQSTRDYIGLTKQKTLVLHIPEIEEQRKIARSLNTLDRKIQRDKEEKEQLQRLKKGLMQDLLTGEVRTSEDVEVLPAVKEVEE